MNTELIHEIVETLQSEMLDSDDLRTLYFYKGAFYVFADQLEYNRLNVELLYKYLSVFLSKEECMRGILEKANPALLSKLEKLLSIAAKMVV